MQKERPNLALFLLAMLAYAVLLIASIWILQREPDPIWQIPLALAPAVPGLFAALVIAREVSRQDELQRRIQLEALAFAFPATAAVALSLGLLENAGLAPLNGTFYVPIMTLLWLAGQIIAGRKYR